MKREMKRRALLIPLLLNLLFVACDGSITNPGNGHYAGPPVLGDRAIIRLEGEPDNLNPLTGVTAFSHYVMWGAMNSQVYELLMSYNPKDWDLTEPLLAEAPPTVSEDHLTYTVKIRDGVKWHDGKPFTADDVLFTFKATACPLTDAAPLRSYLNNVADVQLDGSTIRFTMSKADVYNIRNVTNVLAIIPKHIFDETGLLDAFTFKDLIGPKGKTDPKIKEFADRFNKHPAGRAPVGTGPFKFEKWDSGREIVLARNDDYWGKKPYLDKIQYLIITDYTAALAALKAGEVDFNPRLLPVQYTEQTAGEAFDGQFTKVKFSIPAQYYIFWNEDRPFFKDKRVRQAMTMLVDRQKIIDTVRLGFGEIGISPFHPKSKDFNTNLKPLPYDPKKAMELLDAAGWKDHDGDGVRDKDGVKFKFEFLGSASSPVFNQLASILVDAFRGAGIEMTEKAIELALVTQTLKDHKFDASTIAFTFDLVQDPYQQWHSSSAAGGSNFENFKNAESDRLIEQARVEFNDEKRKQLYWQWQELIQDEQPVTFLFYQAEPAAYSKRFRDVQWLPLRPGYDPRMWWVPPAEQRRKPTAP